MTRKITAVLIAAFVGILIVWDVYVAANSVPGDTESELTRDLAFRHPFIVLAVCTLVPHFFIPRPHSSKTHKILVVILAVLGVAAFVLDILGLLPVASIFGLPRYFGLVPYCLAGFGLGFLWPQKPPKEIE